MERIPQYHAQEHPGGAAGGYLLCAGNQAANADHLRLGARLRLGTHDLAGTGYRRHSGRHYDPDEEPFPGRPASAIAPLTRGAALPETLSIVLARAANHGPAASAKPMMRPRNRLGVRPVPRRLERSRIGQLPVAVADPGQILAGSI